MSVSYNFLTIQLKIVNVKINVKIKVDFLKPFVLFYGLC